MPRKFGSVNVAIWNDQEWRDLPPAAQHLYMLLWTSADLSFCGVHDWRPGRLTKLSAGFTEEHTRAVADCLIARHFLVTDEETEEVLIRSWARFDEVLKQPRLAVSYANAYTSVYSPILRRVLAHETRKMQDLWPDLACWGDERLSEILGHEAISAKDLPTPEDPFGDGFGHRFGDGFGLGLPQAMPRVSPRVCPPPTPAPTPAPHTVTPLGADKSASPKRASQIPDGWQPSEKHRQLAGELGVNVDHEADKFRDHALANGKTLKDWEAGFRTWLRNAPKFGNAQPASRPRVLRRADQIEQPPDGLSEVEYAAWVAQQAQRRA